MVRIHVKLGNGSDNREFLYDCLSSVQIDQLAEQLLRISNLLYRVNLLAAELEPRFATFRGDPKALSLIRALSEAKSYVSKDQLIHNKPLSYQVLRDYIQALEKELMASFEVVGLPDLDHVRHLLADPQILQKDTTWLCWAGKELIGEKRLCDYIGTNEKTKIILKLESS